MTSGNTAASTNYIGTNNAIDFRTFSNGVERMTVESNGRVGIGTTTPDADLHSEGTFRITAGGNGFEKFNVAYEPGGYTFMDIHDGNSIVDFRLMTQGDSYLNGDGNLGIFTTTPAYKYQLYNNENVGATSIGESTNDAISGVAFSAYNTSATNGWNAFEGATDGTGAGVMGLHLPTTGGGFGVYGATNSVVTAWAGFFAGDLGCTQTFFGSDERWKKNIEPMSGVLEKILSLQVKTYDMRADEYPGMGFTPNETKFGFIAQELKLVFPELVKQKPIPNATSPVKSKGNVDFVTDYHMVDYVSMIPVLTKGIQEQQLQIDSLYNDLNNTLNTNTLLNNRIVASETGRMDTELFLASPSTKGQMFGVCELNDKGEQVIRKDGMALLDVDSSNGAVLSGDFISVSNDGRGIKSLNPEWVIGRALEDADNGKVKIRIDFRYKQ